MFKFLCLFWPAKTLLVMISFPVYSVLVSRSKLVEQQRDSSSNWQVETLKTKLMKLRKENEILKRKLFHSDEG